jgi:hypothetical protein
MTHIPNQYTPKQVARFLPIIRTVLDQHRRSGVASVKFDPLELGINVNTGQARLRDAARSLLLGFVKHPTIDQETLKAVWPLYQVTSDGVNVVVTSRNPEHQVEPQTTTDEVFNHVVLRTDEAGFVEELTALALLFGRRRIKGQVDIVGDLSETLQHRITSENDVIFIADGHQKYHMI